ncbi:zinc finger MYM-type protein 1-like [Aphis gossypii]|uniref:zinc finger MYM-type protein 1-like n=1 Tax=Aphis gossypii TaxID=80765 RepID=UPI0021593D15|nr:zinc finger MYM-type protein 1-like [Aphis gossypii]
MFCNILFANKSIKLFTDISQNKNETPVQPVICFPKTNGRRFNSNLYEHFKWLEYSVLKNKLYCFCCRHFGAGLLQRGQSYGETAFDDLSKNKSIANLVNFQRETEVIENRKHIYFSLKATIFLCKQGLVFRGHDESLESTNRGNFVELIDSFADENLKLNLSRRYGHYTSPYYQNDFISIVAQSIRKNILSTMTNLGTYTILVDETKDASHKEQLSFIIRFVDKNYKINERSIGCYHMSISDAETFANEIINITCSQKLDIKNCISQCYDGAVVMSGKFSGVQSRIQEIVPHAIYIHCFAHRQTRYELFEKIQKKKKNLEILHLERLVNTRWSYWYTLIKKVKLRFTEIKEVLEILADTSTDESDEATRTTSHGLVWQISTIEFITLLCVIENLLEKIHCVSCELQSDKIVLQNAIELIQSTKNELLNNRNEDSWNLLQEKSINIALQNNITLKNKRNIRSGKVSKKLDDYYVLTTVGKKTDNPQANDLLMIDVYYTVIDSTVSNERFFSTLKRVKNYLRLTMGDKRLSDLMVIATEKEEVDTLDLNEVVDSFAKLKSRRFPLL